MSMNKVIVGMAVMGGMMSGQGVLADDSRCPGSKAWISHAQTELDVTFSSNSCEEVKTVIVNRANGSQNGQWVDPHNKGKYTVLSNDGDTVELQRETGNGKYTDKMTFTLTTSGEGCAVFACSESQVTSVKDFSTNYCNLHDLYCSDAGCNALAGETALSYDEKITECSSGQHSSSDCYQTTTTSLVRLPFASTDVVVDETASLYEIKDGVCGQTTLDKKYESYAEKFDGNLKEGTCASQGYTVPAGSETHKYPIVGDITIAKFTKPALLDASTVDLYQIKDGVCGQVTLDKKYESYAEKFDSDLKEGTCASQGYTVADGTKTENVPFLGAITISKFTKPSIVLRGSEGACQPVETQSDFDIDAYIAKRWYIQQQMPTKYLPKDQNYCVYAEYTKMDKKNFWGYSIQVHNYAQEADGTKHDSKKIICATVDSAYDTDAKLQVGLCALPRIKSVTTGPYWIVAYDEEKGYALVSGGQPNIETGDGKCKTGSGVNNSGLWIFTRQQARDDALVNEVRALAESKGFDLSVLNDVDQTNC